MSSTFQPLTLVEYTNRALQTDQRVDSGSLAFPLLGLFGETGGLLSELKKKQRDKVSFAGYAEAVVEELGDVLWYLTILCSRAGLSLLDLVQNLNRVPMQEAGVGDLSFAHLQPGIKIIGRNPTPAFETTLLKLAGQVGLLVEDQQAGLLISNKAAFSNRLIAIMHILVQAATEAGITLEAAAVKNLAKIDSRWPQTRFYPKPFDDEYEKFEQLPRELTIDIVEREVAGQTFVFQTCNDLNIGDRLTDNAAEPDDYRFHDVFHYAYIAVLTWSPVVRGLLRLKRKSNRKVDEVEDGARAMLIEEGITTWLFSKAQPLDFFANINAGNLPLTMLKHVRDFVSGYEVDKCPLWLWEEAILQGYSAFRFLQKHRRGRVHIDMLRHSLTVQELTT